MTHGALDLPEISVAQPSGAQVKLDLRREGTLVWMVQQMAEEMKGYELNILAADLTNPEQINKVIDWQARRQVLEQWLDRLTSVIEEENE